MPTEARSRAPELDALMARFRATGDSEALGVLFDVTSPGLFRLALTLVPDPASAEDVVQETFLAAIESADRHDPGRPVLPWLVGILHHKASKIRDRHRRMPDPHRLPPLVVPGDPAHIAADREEEERVRAALDELPEPYREVALLRWRHGLEPAEIAALKRTSPGTVRSHLHRALEKVRRRMVALPTLLFARVTERDPRGLDAVRRIVVGKAGAAAPVAGGAMAATAIGGLLMAKKALAAVVILLLGAGAWWALSSGTGDTGSGARRLAPGVSETRIVDGTSIKVVGPQSEAFASPLPTAGERVEGTEKGFATGVVVNREDKPVAGALVVSLPDSLPGPTTAASVAGPGGVGRSARTDEQGRFRVPLPESSALSTLYIEAEGYAPTVETEVPQRGADTRIVLDRPALITGRVLDLAGSPVSGARIRLLFLMDIARVERNAVSGEDGAYRVEGVPPRRRFARPLQSDAVIEVRADGFAPLLTGLFFPPTNAIANPGEEGHLDLYLTRGASLIGRVVDGETGAPVEGARVVLISIEQAIVTSRPGQTTFAPGLIVPRILGETLSAADGAFRFDGLPAKGKMPLLASNIGKKGLQLGVVGAIKQGFAPFTDEVPVVDEGVVVEATLRLWPAASVTGRVVEKDGRPVEGAGVRVEVDGRLENAWFPADLFPGVPSVAGKTNAEGRYRLEGVRATHEGTSDARVLAARHGMVSLNQPGGTPIEVTAGKTTEVPDIALEEPPDPSVSFLVVDGGGKPVWGAMVTGSIQAFSGRTGKDGRVLLRSPIHGSSYRPDAPPEIDFTIQARGYGRARVTAAPSTTGTPEVRVVLGEGHGLSGVVKEADGSPAAAGTQVTVADGNLSVEEAFQVSSGIAQPRGLYAWASCGENGRFSVEDLPPGPYHVRAVRVLRKSGLQPVLVMGRGGQQSAPVITATVSGVASDAKDVKVVLPVEETPATEAVEGTVVDASTGQPVELRVVALMKGTDQARGGQVPSTPGSFRFPEVPSGDWTLLLHAEGYAAEPVKVQVRPGSRPRPITLRLGRGATVRGAFRPPPGASVEGWKAVFVLTGSMTMPRVVAVDKDGRFEASGFLPGRYRVSVGPADSPRAGSPAHAPRDARALEVPEGDATVTFETDVVPAGELYVKVTDTRFPPDPTAAGGAATDEQRRLGEAARMEIRDLSGAVLEERRDLSQGWVFFGLALPAGEYTVRLVLPGGEVREEKAIVRPGDRTSVRL